MELNLEKYFLREVKPPFIGGFAYLNRSFPQANVTVLDKTWK